MEKTHSRPGPLGLRRRNEMHLSTDRGVGLWRTEHKNTVLIFAATGSGELLKLRNRGVTC